MAELSGTICGMYLASEDARQPEQVVRGFTERFAAELTARGGLTEPQRYGKTFTAAHDPDVARVRRCAADRSRGAHPVPHPGDRRSRRGRPPYRGLLVASNAGVGAHRAARIIDASGDGAVVARGGGAYRFGADGRIQNPTMFFRLGNVDTRGFWAAWGQDTISRHGSTRRSTPPEPAES